MQVLECFADLLWFVRHPTARKCPRCGLTWELRKDMRRQGGVCHDCYFDDEAERANAR